MQNSVASSGLSAQAPPVRAMWGVFNRKERWSLSWRGRLIVASALLLMVVLLFKGVYPFLATTKRVGADVLVVEGWVHEYTIRAAVDEFRSGSYKRVFATGGPVVGTGGYINDFYTSASVGAELLRKNGLANGSVQEVPSRVMDRDRTYGSAVALRNWLREHNMSVSGINVITEDLHARRTRLLFHEALGDKVDVGVIGIPSPDYDTKRWWRYSDGVREVIGESIAYIYAKLFFHPSKSMHEKKAAVAPLTPMARTPADRYLFLSVIDIKSLALTADACEKIAKTEKNRLP
jgi:uncharacterized SAM-binding protein YcdF (DUF218 family)